MPVQCVLSEATFASYLTVESEDPVTMTLSSYCRHNTEPVWPVSIFRHSRDCLSQICDEKKNRWRRKRREEYEWVGDTNRGGERGEISCFDKVTDLGHSKNGLFSQQRSCPISPLLRWALCVICKSHSALLWVCISLLQNNKTNLLFSSLHPPHLFIIFYSPLLPGQTENTTGLELSLFIR